MCMDFIAYTGEFFFIFSTGNWDISHQQTFTAEEMVERSD